MKSRLFTLALLALFSAGSVGIIGAKGKPVSDTPVTSTIEGDFYMSFTIHLTNP